jgi:hypothetical protein
VEFIRGLFTGSYADMSRYNLWGAGMLVLGLLLNALAARLGRRIGCGDLVFRLSGLALGMFGALIAMKLIG